MTQTTISQDDLAKAAALLSIEPAEIHDLLNGEDGTTLVKTTDGATYIIVPDDRPDHEGKYGVMFLVPPHPKYGGSFPVYATPGVAAGYLQRIADAPSFADLARIAAEYAETEDDFVSDLTGGDVLADPPPKPGPEEVATHEALKTRAGPPSEPVPAPGVEHAEAVVDAAAGPGKEAVDQAIDQATDAGDPVDPDKAEAAKDAVDPAAKRPRKS